MARFLCISHYAKLNMCIPRFPANLIYLSLNNFCMNWEKSINVISSFVCCLFYSRLCLHKEDCDPRVPSPEEVIGLNQSLQLLVLHVVERKAFLLVSHCLLSSPPSPAFLQNQKCNNSHQQILRKERGFSICKCPLFVCLFVFSWGHFISVPLEFFCLILGVCFLFLFCLFVFGFYFRFVCFVSA